MSATWGVGPATGALVLQRCRNRLRGKRKIFEYLSEKNLEGGATGAPDDAAVYSMNIYEAIQRNNGVALQGYDDLTLTMVSAWCLLGN